MSTSAPSLPAAGAELRADYAERVYAGVLGKLIGVYLGRPVEGWTYERIAAELGEVAYYVNARLGRPLVVTDDDISGTFTFVRAFADYGDDADLSAEQIGQTWLNYLIEHKTVLWWGGLGNSTEHTAYLRLKHGVPAPHSGSSAVNSRVVAEQIGAQIFIDSWAMLCPGDPERAADYARRAASVSHDGEAIYAAQVVAAMEAAAFTERRLGRLLDEALRYIPADSTIAHLIANLREWREADDDWRRTLARIQGRYGYDRYGGNVHIVPNHALIHLGLLYGDDDFGRSLMITTSAGWDTDCNAGNVGCLLGIKQGLAAFAGERDWRGPLADRLYISSADGGRAVSDALTEAGHLVVTARALRGLAPQPPKGVARFHFSFPGSVQGWHGAGDGAPLHLENVALPGTTGGRCLALRWDDIGPRVVARAASATFIPPDAFDQGGYSLQASPTLYGGQTVRAAVQADVALPGPVTLRLFARAYGEGAPLDVAGTLRYGPPTELPPGQSAELAWTLPPGDGAPIHEVGLEIAAPQSGPGAVYLDRLGWSGPPRVTWRGPAAATPAARRAWVSALDVFQARRDGLYTCVENQGRGMAITGQRTWADYTVAATIRPHMCPEVGLAARVQGLQRYYALLLGANGRLRLVKRAPGEAPQGGLGERTLAERDEPFELDRPYRLELQVQGGIISARVDGQAAFRVEDEAPLMEGAIALIVANGRADVDEVVVEGT